MALSSVVVLALLAQSPLDARVELQLIPITAQVNVLHSEHFGSGGRLTVRLNRYLAGYASGFGHWHTSPAPGYDDLRKNPYRIEQYFPTQVLSTWQAVLGLESIPLSGTFHIGQRTEGEFGLVVRAGAGLGGGRLRLVDSAVRSDGSTTPARFVDVGLRVVGDFGLGFRFGFGAFALHLGPRLSMWSDELTRLNNCSIDDLRAMDQQVRAGLDYRDAAVAPGCVMVERNDVPLAMSALRHPRLGPLVVNVSIDVGVSWAF